MRIIKIRVLRKVLVNNFALSEAEDNTSRPLNRGGTADLPLLRTLFLLHFFRTQTVFCLGEFNFQKMT